MYEVEVKVPASLESVRERLEELGADREGVVIQEDTYYDAPHRAFAETDEALRIRRESRPETDAAETKLTYKGPLVDDRSKTREEVETGVESAGDVDAILTNLGFDAAATVRKERERFSVDGYVVTLDDVDGVGEYVEVETDAETEADLESARDGAFTLLERLGLDPTDQVRTSYLGLLLEGGD
ncbi:class IV adenylate cyclase [Natrialbaceae archaeon GCM10025810]|uniref:class IV adenylate cyclase n=1 Tax=Halovalidus salilacus TaxID=3075124 RepID=UPI00361B1B0A